jgi:hypothetical protein
MSFREKAAWISLLLNVVFYGYYVWRLYEVAAAGQTETFHYGGLLVQLIILLVIAQIVLNVIAAAARPKDVYARADERERLIHFKAANVGYAVCLSGAGGVAVAIALGWSAFYTANALFLVLVLAESSRNAAQIFFYRRGA